MRYHIHSESKNMRDRWFKNKSNALRFVSSLKEHGHRPTLILKSNNGTIGTFTFSPIKGLV